MYKQIIFTVFFILINSYSIAFSASKKTNLDAIEKCAKRAEELMIEEFGEKSFTNRPLRDGSAYDAYQKNHYNIKLNKCFYVSGTWLHGQKNGKFFSIREESLKDAYERVSYGQLMVSSDGEVSLCFVRDMPRCKSEMDWDMQILKYMEN